MKVVFCSFVIVDHVTILTKPCGKKAKISDRYPCREGYLTDCKQALNWSRLPITLQFIVKPILD